MIYMSSVLLGVFLMKKKLSPARNIDKLVFLFENHVNSTVIIINI